MPTPMDETGDASVANGGMEPSTDAKTVGEDTHSAGDADAPLSLEAPSVTHHPDNSSSPSHPPSNPVSNTLPLSESIAPVSASHTTQSTHASDNTHIEDTQSLHQEPSMNEENELTDEHTAIESSIETGVHVGNGSSGSTGEPSSSSVDPREILAQLAVEADDFDFGDDSRSHESDVDPEMILAQIRAETENFNSSGSEMEQTSPIMSVNTIERCSDYDICGPTENTPVSATDEPISEVISNGFGSKAHPTDIPSAQENPEDTRDKEESDKNALTEASDSCDASITSDQQKTDSVEHERDLSVEPENASVDMPSSVGEETCVVTQEEENNETENSRQLDSRNNDTNLNLCGLETHESFQDITFTASKASIDDQTGNQSDNANSSTKDALSCDRPDQEMTDYQLSTTVTLPQPTDLTPSPKEEVDAESHEETPSDVSNITPSENPQIDIQTPAESTGISFDSQTELVNHQAEIHLNGIKDEMPSGRDEGNSQDIAFHSLDVQAESADSPSPLEPQNIENTATALSDNSVCTASADSMSHMTGENEVILDPLKNSEEIGDLPTETLAYLTEMENLDKHIGEDVDTTPESVNENDARDLKSQEICPDVDEEATVVSVTPCTLISAQNQKDLSANLTANIESNEGPGEQPTSSQSNVTSPVAEESALDISQSDQTLPHEDAPKEKTVCTPPSGTLPITCQIPEQTLSEITAGPTPDTPDHPISEKEEDVDISDFVLVHPSEVPSPKSANEFGVVEANIENGGEETRQGDDTQAAGQHLDSPTKGKDESATNGGHVLRENSPDTSESSPKVNIDVPTVSAAMHIKKTDNTTTDGQAGSKVEEGDDKVGDLSSHVQRREKGGGGDVSSDKRKSLMLWVDPQLVQTVRVEQGVSKSPQHSPENIPNDMKRLKKVVRKERWAAETEHEVRKDVWKKLCLQNSAGASVANIYSEVEEGLFGPDKAATDQSSMTLPSFVDPDHPTACYALLSEGQMRLNRLLCVFADTRPDILYCPLLAPVASMLLHYMSPEDTFDCLSALLGSTRYKFLEISWVGYESFRMSFEKLASRFASSAHKFVAKQGDVAEIYKDWVWWILEDLPFSHLIRVMDCYLSEGLKIFYRVGLALLKLYKKHKGSSPAQDIVASIRQFVKSIPESPNALLAEGFQFRGLSRSVIGAYQTKHKQQLREDNSPSRRNTQRQNDALSKLTPIKSSVISHQQLHTLWGWVPSRFSVYQPSLVFTTQEHGFSLTTFYTRCEYCEPTILLIKTADQEIFGAYLSASWSTRNDEDHKGIYFGTGESFLFSLAPEEKKYPWVGINTPGKEDKEEEEEVEEGKEDMKKRMSEMFMRATPSLIAVGGGDGDGILIEGDLTKGFSGRCLTFNNPPLASERSYVCAVIEVITMEDGRNPTENNA
ncbi:uncharacterized protein [Diadema antillarum]|uniref:uncharacterized protein isoform X1 n=1 Tax=Diadema antillarum TaxID=105358 RepID=UPI003A851220